MRAGSQRDPSLDPSLVWSRPGQPRGRSPHTRPVQITIQAEGLLCVLGSVGRGPTPPLRLLP